MSEYQILGLMLILQGLLTVVGIMIGFQTHREARTIFQIANETLLRVQIMPDAQGRTVAMLDRMEKRLGSS
jgi:hypothetical protein